MEVIAQIERHDRETLITSQGWLGEWVNKINRKEGKLKWVMNSVRERGACEVKMREKERGIDLDE